MPMPGFHDQSRLPDFEAALRFLSPEEGGRKTPAHQGYRPDVRFAESPHTWMINPEFLREDGTPYAIGEPVPTSVRANMYVIHESARALVRPLVYTGRTVEIVEGTHPVAIGEITAIKNLPNGLITRMRFVRLHPEITLTRADFDEVRDFTSLVIRVRDEADVGVNIEFRSYLLYSRTNESYFFTRDVAEELFRSEDRGHWLYEVHESPLLQHFKARNPHINPLWDVRHYLVVVEDDVMDVIAAEQPRISKRTDSVRGWIRPGEKRSAPPGWDGTSPPDDPI